MPFTASGTIRSSRKNIINSQVILATYLKAQETARDMNARYRWKWRLVRGLYEQGWPRQDVLELFRFLDWVMRLPEAEENRLWSEL